MMRVKLLTSMAGLSFSYKRGQEVELDDAVALRLLATNQAEHVLPSLWGGQSKDWPLKGISPTDYLKRFPTGPNAELARRCMTETR